MDGEHVKVKIWKFFIQCSGVGNFDWKMEAWRSKGDIFCAVTDVLRHCSARKQRNSINVIIILIIIFNYNF